MNKKIRLLALLVLALSLLFSATAHAAGDDEAKLYYVTDEAAILSGSQRMELENRAGDISREYQCSIYIVALEDYTDYTSGSVTDCAKAIYKNYSLGWGSDKNGVLLLLSMYDRDYSIIAYGDFANAAFTDYGKDALSDEFLDDFRYDDWYAGFSDYLEYSAKLMDKAENGKPLDAGKSGTSPVVKLLMIVILPCVAAFAVCSAFISRMKTARKKNEAGDYMVPEGVELRIREDIFTHRTEHREHIENKSGGTSVGSDGFSSKSGKF